MSKISKYQVVERAIRDAIIDGTLKVGDQLMPLHCILVYHIRRLGGFVMSKISKYQVVERAIRDAIIDGTLKVGDQLMTEEELCARFGFSRTTIGKALDNLRAHGYIERVAGRGTFVKAAHVEKQAGSSSSFTEDMASIGLKAGAKLISYEVLRARDVPVRQSGARGKTGRKLKQLHRGHGVHRSQGRREAHIV